MPHPRINQRFRVYIGLVNTGYTDPTAIQAHIREGISYCGIDTLIEKNIKESKHSVLVKPSFVHADAESSRYAHTAAEVVQSTFESVLAFDPQARFELLTDSHPLGFSSRTMHLSSGYTEKLKKYREKMFLTNENNSEKVVYHLIKNQKIIIDSSASYLNNDLRVYCPKIRTDILSSGFAGAVRIGLENIFTPDSEEKIANHLEICNPELVIGDGIYIPIGGSRITQSGQELGVILVSNNAVAHDMIAASILNLAPERIQHLKIAIDKGWGPVSLSEIELGGAGETAFKALAIKTRPWHAGFYPLNRIKDKYELENPGLRFPFEIFSDSPLEKTANSHVSSLVADLFCTVFDTPKLRAKLARWPKSTLVCGEVQGYPHNNLIYVLGTEAIRQFSSVVSTVEMHLELGLFSIERVKLKNGNSITAIKVRDSHIGYWSLSIIFFITSGGRMKFPLFKTKQFLNVLVTKLVRFLKPVKSEKSEISSKLQQNEWWAL